MALGHKRLSIIDLATGQQPLFNEDGSVVVVYNGEIYNYRELIPELTQLGHTFRTRSDTEVIVHAWEAWGEDCVKRFRGMFAFALWDQRQQTLFMARDRLGVKPLYYATLPDGMVALRLGAEGAAGPRQPEPRRSIRARSKTISLSATCPSRARCSAPRTSWRRATRCACGAVRRAAQPRALLGRAVHAGAPISAADAQAELLERLKESVRLRMISEVPLGAFLSGGVDSSAVVAMMAGLSRRSGEHLLDRVRRSGVRRIALRRRSGASATARAISSTASKATTST